MSGLRPYQTAPYVYTGNPLSATEFNIYLNNCAILHELALRNENPFIQGQMTKGFKAQNGDILWKGGFLYRQGMTQAVFSFKTDSPRSDVYLTIFFNGTQVYNQNINDATPFKTVTISINDKGYVDYTAVSVVVKLTTTNSSLETKYSYYSIWDAYVTPLDAIMTTAWPSVPTFTNLTQTNINQLADAQNWLAQRFALVPYNINMNERYWNGMAKLGDVDLYFMTVSTNAYNKHLKGSVYIINAKNDQTSLKIVINGQTYTYGPYGVTNGLGINIDIDLAAIGCVDGTNYDVRFYEHCTDTVKQTDPTINTKWTTGDFQVAGGITVAQPSYPNPFQILQQMYYGDVLSAFNSVGTITSGAYLAIQANPKIFNRARMYRDRFGVNNNTDPNDPTQMTGQDSRWVTTLIPFRQRVGDILWIKGRSCKINWGGYTAKTEDGKTYEYSWDNSEDLTSGDAIETKLIGLDQFEGLYPGVLYFITGDDIQYAQEYLQ